MVQDKDALLALTYPRWVGRGLVRPPRNVDLHLLARFRAVEGLQHLDAAGVDGDLVFHWVLPGQGFFLLDGHVKEFAHDDEIVRMEELAEQAEVGILLDLLWRQGWLGNAG